MQIQMNEGTSFIVFREDLIKETGYVLFLFPMAPIY